MYISIGRAFESQKVMTISSEKRTQAIALLDSGISAEAIASQLGMSSKTVRRIRNESRPGITKSKGGRPGKLSEVTKRLVKRSIISGKADTATQVASQLCEGAIAEFNPATIRRALRESGMVARSKAKKPRLLARHKSLRYQFAKKYKDWTVDD